MCPDPDNGGRVTEKPDLVDHPLVYQHLAGADQALALSNS